MERQDFETAHACFVESVSLKQELGEQWGICSLLETFVELAVRRRQWIRAARLHGAASVLWEKIGTSSGTGSPPAIKEKIAGAIQAALGDAAFGEASKQSRAMTVEQAVLYAGSREAL
jgi:hypothetical protein